MVGDRSDFAPVSKEKGYGSEGLRLLEEEFSTVSQWDLCTVLQDAGMVAFYEKNGYHQTHIEPEKRRHGYGLHEKIDREIERTVRLNF